MSTKPELLPVQACTGLTGAPHRSDQCDLGSSASLVCPKSLTILPLKCLDHHPQLKLMTRQPTHQLHLLIILILQTINIMWKFQIF
jgi:hypothetical protein